MLVGVEGAGSQFPAVGGIVVGGQECRVGSGGEGWDSEASDAAGELGEAPADVCEVWGVVGGGVLAD